MFNGYGPFGPYGPYGPYGGPSTIRYSQPEREQRIPRQIALAFQFVDHIHEAITDPPAMLVQKPESAGGGMDVEKPPGRKLDTKETEAYVACLSALKGYVDGERYIDEQPEAEWVEQLPEETGFYFLVPHDADPMDASPVLVGEYDGPGGETILVGACRKMPKLLPLDQFPDGWWMGPLASPPNMQKTQSIRFREGGPDGEETPQTPGGP
jgi:hypothetical protein